jgi:hypothetical protein
MYVCRGSRGNSDILPRRPPKLFLLIWLVIRINFFSDGRFGVVAGILADYARGREFDSRIVQTFVCMIYTFVLGLGVSIMYVFTKKSIMYLSVI